MFDTPLSEAILRTLLYADVFSYPLTAAEIHYYLIDVKATLTQVKQTLAQSVWLQKRVETDGDYYGVRGHAEYIELRKQRTESARKLWPTARHFGTLLAHLPFVRMVAVTGALAVANSHDPHDDIDYLIVAQPGRVWITRALAILIVRIARLMQVGLCPNYVLAANALAQDRRDLFTAHEIAQMVPLAGFATY